MNGQEEHNAQESALAAQYKRLKELAHMAAHNLRGPVTNHLSLLQLYKRMKTMAEKDLIIEKLELVTQKLLSTIDDFSAVLKNNEKGLLKQEVYFSDVLKETIQLFSETINETQADIRADFLACPAVHYRKAIIESIFQNLVSNSIKYRTILTPPRIFIRSFKREDGRCILTFRDNGSGFDLHKNGSQVFGLYNTFHENDDAQGVGLYLVKSQLEEQGGEIRLESEPDRGSLFTLVL